MYYTIKWTGRNDKAILVDDNGKELRVATAVETATLQRVYKGIIVDLHDDNKAIGNGYYILGDRAPGAAIAAAKAFR